MHTAIDVFPEDVVERQVTVEILAPAREGSSADSGSEYNEVLLPTVPVEIVDDDAADVVIIQTGQGTTVSEGILADNYEVVLSREPAGDVHIDVTPSNANIDVDDNGQWIG